MQTCLICTCFFVCLFSFITLHVIFFWTFPINHNYTLNFWQALRYLGFRPTEEQQRELRQRLPSDQGGFVSYGGKNIVFIADVTYVQFWKFM